MPATGIFTDDFLLALRTLVNVHHSIYPLIPPQGIYFEALVEQAFKRVKKPFTPVKGTVRNQPVHDLIVERSRISLKTETGARTHPKRISITKLCTTEKEPWTPEILIRRAMEHLRQYEVILMLRSVWEPPLIHYQLLEIPVDLLRLIEIAPLAPVGRRKGRQSIGADVYRGDTKVFRVHFDGADGKCQIKNLRIEQCEMLLEWDLAIQP
ncbi:MAG TPA: hypothetical protein VKI65_21005 [Gemmataceae bacterium]|nr:hypothetical protein [Gemmataceae bacterium]